MYEMENDNINILEHDINKNNDVSEKTVELFHTRI
jgi:hypothetical protein